MDIREETIKVMKEYYRYKNKVLPQYDYIKILCHYFDSIKYNNNIENYIELLMFLANDVGLPQYVSMLDNFQKKKLETKQISLDIVSTIINEAKLTVGQNIMLHQFQYDFLKKFQRKNSTNRYILSAPTSFGKTFIVYEIIKKMEYNNIVLVFPTISLLSENYDKIMLKDEYKDIRENYKIHTLSNIGELGQKNIWIYTPERYMSYTDKNPNQKFDFIFIDEIYKIDNEFIINEEIKENERDTAFRLALSYSCENSRDMLLVGPYIQFDKIEKGKNKSFNNFVVENRFEIVDYNKYEIVNKEIIDIKTKKYYQIDGKEFHFDNINSKFGKLEEILRVIESVGENAIIYCKTKPEVERYVKEFIKRHKFNNLQINSNNDIYIKFLRHIKSRFGQEWIVYKALQKGIGIHHGVVPKYIQKQIIEFFNEGIVKYIFSTTTITEGVNTSAKNMIITSSNKGNKTLKHFDAQNIAGRAGRFTKHYKGNIIVLQNEFEKILEEEGETIKHKNYDDTNKDEVDYYMTKKEYLSQQDKDNISKLKVEQEKRKIPDEIMKQFKVVGYSDKFKIYDRLKDGVYDSVIRNFIMSTNSSNMSFSWNDFEVIMDIIMPIIPQNSKLSKLANIKIKTYNGKEYSLLTIKLFNYIKNGFYSLIEYQVKERKLSVDEAVRDTGDFVYNVLKYQLVKYLGVFDLMYRYIKSIKSNIKIEDVSGINKFLQILEYNALSDNARLVSDYGAPFNVVKSFEEGKNDIQKEFDEYEKYIRSKVEKLLNNGNII